MKNKSHSNTADSGAGNITLKQKVSRYVDEIHFLDSELNTIAALCIAFDNTAEDSKEVMNGVGYLIEKHLWLTNVLRHHYLDSLLDNSIPKDIFKSSIVRLNEIDKIKEGLDDEEEQSE